MSHANSIATRQEVLKTVVKLGEKACEYGGTSWPRFCDCKYGGPVEQQGSEQSGCPELCCVHTVLSKMTDEEYMKICCRTGAEDSDASFPSWDYILSQVQDERTRQLQIKGYTPIHDSSGAPDGSNGVEGIVRKFAEHICDYAGMARIRAGQDKMAEARKILIQIAAMAVAAVHAMDCFIVACRGSQIERYK